MVRQPVHQHAFAALGIAALLATLGFLLERALSTEFHPDARALTLLRELADSEMRRDSQAGRLAGDFTATAPDGADRTYAASLVRRELERTSSAASVAPRMPALRQALDERDAAYRHFRRAHGDTLVALQAAETPLSSLERAAQAGRPRNADAALALASLADAIRQDLHEGDIERVNEISARLAARTPLVVPAATALDAQLGDLARSARNGVDGFIAARTTEAKAWQSFAYASAGEQIQLAVRTLERRVDAALDERERWRIYLVAYACALGIALSWIFFRQSGALGRERRAHQSILRRLAEQDGDLAAAKAGEERAQSQLVAMGRYWSIGQLTAGISREIARPLADARTQLSAVRSALPDLRGAQEQAQHLVDLMRSTKSDPRQVDKAVSTLANHLQHLKGANAIDDLDSLAWGGMRDVEHIAELMAQLRTFFRADSDSPASFNVNDAVQAALLIAQPLLRGLKLERELGDLPAIDCRPGEVIQLLLSLVARAAQAAPRDGGRVRVATRSLPDGVALEIWNQGLANNDDDDLAIARTIVARHAGGIAVRPKDDGTLVAVELPLAAARSAAIA
ncbi:MAG TPA: hypothetical protein VFE23_16320 [Usitatibacter sp.]|jgi:hypothetical protein|nr:hypothetical protein [Usitatibacter sp.]